MMKISKKHLNIVLTQKQLNRSKDGGHGFYIRLDRKFGMKVIGNGSRSLEKLIKSSAWIRADMENDTYNKLTKSKITPKVAKLTVVQANNKFYPAIVMEHIQGKTLYELFDRQAYDKNYHIKFHQGKIIRVKSHQEIIIDVISRYFNKIFKNYYGIYNDDIHANNIIVTSSGKIKIVDFSPGYSGPVD